MRKSFLLAGATMAAILDIGVGQPIARPVRRSKNYRQTKPIATNTNRVGKQFWLKGIRP